MNSFRRRPLALLIVALLAGSTPLSVLAAAQAAAATTPATTSATAKANGNDPLLRYQWHISNQGQAVIGDSRPVAGVDMDVDILHALGIRGRGRGVRVGVVDDGLELGHEDLADNILPNGSHNFGDGSHDTTPIDPNNGHGTSVAGIIGAVGWNGRGGRGVAPEVQLAGFDMFARDASVTDASVRYA